MQQHGFLNKFVQRKTAVFKFRKLRRKSNAGIKRSDILHFFHHVVNAAFIHGLEERAVVLQAGKRAGAEAPFDVYVCTSLSKYNLHVWWR